MTHEERLQWTLEQYSSRQEEWRPIAGFESRYEVSSHGRVRGLRRETRMRGGRFGRFVSGKLLNPSCDKVGKNVSYNRVKLCDGVGGVTRMSVSRLVASAFIPNPLGLPCVDHICGTDGGDGYWNLRWCTYKENSNFDLAKKHQSEAASGSKNHEYGKLGAKNTKSKPVGQYDKDGNLIKVYPGQEEAFRQTGINNINAVLRGRQKTAGGYIWKDIKN